MLILGERGVRRIHGSATNMRPLESVRTPTHFGCPPGPENRTYTRFSRQLNTNRGRYSDVSMARQNAPDRHLFLYEECILGIPRSRGEKEEETEKHGSF
jgi:hypothetical protein